MNTQPRPTILAHRGGSAHAPENTLASFKRGLADGADGFELDVHLSKDEVPVVIHDFTVERVAGPRQAVSALTVRELRALDVGSWFAPEYADQYVPTLEEVFALVQGPEIAINVEIKAGSRIYPGIEEKCLALVAALAGDARVIFSSFDHYCLRRLKEIDGAAVTGALYGCSLIDAHKYAVRIGVDALHPQYDVVDAGLVAGCRQADLRVNTWTVNDPAQARRLQALGVDAIITDDPAKIRAALTDKSS
jgi:glycerophosphoryl diester phosphodiesterase